MLKKRCSKCGIVKDIREFSKCRTNKDGLQTSCKKCKKRYYEKNKERVAEQSKQYYAKHKKRIRECVKEYRENDRERIREKDKKYYDKNREEILNREKEHRQEHPEQIKKYREEHQDQKRRYYQEHRKQHRESIKRYRQTPNGKAVNKRNWQNRRARKNNCEGSISMEEWNRVLKNQNNRCNVCGKKFTAKSPATMDHIVPVKHRGDHNSDNIQALCSHCNSSKNARLDPQYIQTWTHL